MYDALPYKTKQFFFVLIKLAIVIGASYYIYNRLMNNQEMDFRVFIDFISKNDVFTPKNIFFVLILTISNWFLEILKWKELVSVVKKISFIEASKQSLSALTASLFTPNRVGEYGAKAIYYTKRFRKRILLLNLMGNIFQMSITIFLGIIGLYYFLNAYDVAISYYRVSRFGLILLIVVGFGLLGVSQNKFKIKGFSVERIKTFVKAIPFQKKAAVFLISLMRYAIFSFQFYFLLTLLGMQLSYLETMIGITSMYLLASVIPTLFIFDVVVKGSVAVYVFGFLGINELTVLCVVTLMWIMNFVLPSVFGSFHILNFNYYPTEDQ
jgi:hypothetical protein